MGGNGLPLMLLPRMASPVFWSTLRISSATPHSYILVTLGARPLAWKSTYTEGAIGAKHGYRVLTLASFRRDGLLPEWHRPTDTVENVDPDVLNRCESFLWKLLREIDLKSA